MTLANIMWKMHNAKPKSFVQKTFRFWVCCVFLRKKLIEKFGLFFYSNKLKTEIIIVIKLENRYLVWWFLVKLIKSHTRHRRVRKVRLRFFLTKRSLGKFYLKYSSSLSSCNTGLSFLNNLKLFIFPKES